MNFKAFIQEKEKYQWKLHGIMVTENGVVKGQYGDCKNRYPIYSSTKTITSTAVGMAVDEHKFSVEESLYFYIRNRIPAEVPQEQKKIITYLSVMEEGSDQVTKAVEQYLL